MHTEDGLYYNLFTRYYRKNVPISVNYFSILHLGFIFSSNSMLQLPFFPSLSPHEHKSFRTEQITYLDDNKRDFFTCKTDVVPVCVAALKRARV